MKGFHIILQTILLINTAHVYSQLCPDGDTPKGALDIVNGMEQFNLEIFRRLATATDRSLILSPYSIWSVLSLAYLGTRGKSADELRQALGFRGSKLQTLREMKHLFSKLNTRDSNFTLKITENAYLASDITLDKCAQDILGDKLTKVNFEDTANTAALINEEVSRTTQGKIADIVQAPELFGVRMALINAIYFRGTWKVQFNKKMSQSVPFTDDSGNTKLGNIILMAIQHQLFNYVAVRSLKAHIVELPYLGEEISMYVILPDQTYKSDTTELLNLFTKPKLERAIKLMRKTRLDVSFPKFKITTKLNKELQQAAASLGISTLFSPEADFSDFAPGAALKVDSVSHKAVMEVTEEGTAAAAVSSLIATRSGPVLPLYFICNRPFAFLIRHKPSSATLFAGIVRHPKDIEQIA